MAIAFQFGGCETSGDDFAAIHHQLWFDRQLGFIMVVRFVKAWKGPTGRNSLGATVKPTSSCNSLAAT
jgi:hypothetical protein